LLALAGWRRKEFRMAGFIPLDSMRFCRQTILLSLISCITISCTTTFSSAQEPGSANSSESSCTNTNFVSIPSRPTVTSATDTTACGVAELEYGLERQWPGGGANRDDLSGGLRFGLTPKLDFHWFSSDFVHLMNREGDRTGYGDNWLPAARLDG
jgi:hypothetical protein